MRKTFLLLAVMLFSFVLQAQPTSVGWNVIATRSELPNDPDTQPVQGRFIWGDYNNDGHKDAFLIAGVWDAIVQLWKNNGDGTFTRAQADAFHALRQSSAVFIDYDNDGDLDLVITGRYYENGSDDKGNKIFVYENTGAANGYAYVKNDDRTNNLDSRLNMTLGGDNASGRILQVLDYNNDGWMDLIACGSTNYNAWGWNPTKDGSGGWDWLSWAGTVVAKNNQGTFDIDWFLVEKDGGETNMDYFREGSVHTGDVNRDGYVDVLVQGYGGDYDLGWGARLYINNKNGKFTLSPYSDQLNGNQSYETVFVDVNGDGYDDLVEISKSVANVHINDKNGGFTKIDINSNGLIRAIGPSITAGDINNDGKIDLLVSGMEGEDGHDGPRDLNRTKIFYNNGDNTFTAVDVADNMRIRTGSVALVDVNNDGNLDFSNFGWEGIAIALNTLGEDVSANTAPTAPIGLTASFADNKYSLSWLAASDGQTPTDAIRYNVYAKNKETGAVYVYAPVDIATGKLKIGGEIVPLIHGTSFDWNLPEADYEFGVQAVDQADATSSFTIVFPAWDVIATRDELPKDDGTQPVQGRFIWGDYNNDGHKDVFLTAGIWDAIVQLWKNNGDGSFTRVQSDAFQALRQSSAVFIDYDNDGDLDLVVTGRDYYSENGEDKNANRINVYENTGASGNYAYVRNGDRSNELGERLNMNIGDGNSVGRILQVFDYNNDGWMDLIACGATNYNVWGWNPTKDDTGAWDWLSWSGTVVAKNNQGSFEIDWFLVEKDGGETNMDYFREGSVHTGDVNGDGYVDVLVQGYGGDYGLGWGARLYINNKNGKFTLSPYSSELNGNQAYETVFVDVNNDGYDDLVEISKAVANVHINDKNGGFTKIDINSNGLIRAISVSITAGDINNDGWIDLLVSGMDGEEGHDGPRELNTTKLFYNNGDNTFTAADVPGNMRARTGSVALVDVNNDGNLDFSNFGWEGTAIALNKLGYGMQSNTAPTVPTNFAASYADGKFSLSWNASSDAETTEAAIRYNVYAKNTDTGVTYVYAPVDLTTGRLKIGGEIVPLIHGTSFEWNLPNANYEFGVQAIDQADLNSAFVTKTCGASVEVVTLSPADEAVEVAIDAVVAVTFNVPVEGSLAGVTINGEAAEASIEGAVLTIAHGDFENDTEYTVTIPVGAITGYDEAIIWSFRTKLGTGVDNVTTKGNVSVVGQTLYVTGYPASASVVVYNVLGKVVADGQPTESIRLDSGSYIVKVQVHAEGKTYTHKVLLK